jgi:hypothetical protein
MPKISVVFVAFLESAFNSASFGGFGGPLAQTDPEKSLFVQNGLSLIISINSRMRIRVR